MGINSVFNHFDYSNYQKSSSSNENAKLAEYAKQFQGYNESDGSANIFLGGGSSSATPWCAAFVEYCVENCGDSDIADWYEDVGNKWYCPDIYAAAEEAGAIVDSKEAQIGDLVLFDWEGDGVQDHIGIFLGYDDDGNMLTMEGNTNGGEAKIQKRSLDNATFCSMA